MSTVIPSLQAIGSLPDTEIDIAAAALQLARAHAPTADWQSASNHLSCLARKVVQRSVGVIDDPTARAAIIRSLLVDEYGYHGDAETYDDPANADLIRVIERRKGLPVALGILWLHCAQAAGWPAHGLDFPNHFLIALGGDSRYVILDAFADGAPLHATELRTLLKQVSGEAAELRREQLQPVSTRDVLLRLQNNIKLRRLHQGDLKGTLDCLDIMLTIAPQNAMLWCEAALINQRLERISAALHCYDRFLDLSPAGDTADHIRTAVAELRARMQQ